MRTPQYFALALCLTTALAACGSSESDVSADASAVDASNPGDGNTSDAAVATNDAAEDAGEGSDTWDPETCSLSAQSDPPLLWIGADNVGPCDDPCFELVSGHQWNEAELCWSFVQPLMCWRSGTVGAMPTCHSVPGVGTVLFGNQHFSIVNTFPIVLCPSPDPYLAPCD